jgi:hypothetical protein
MLFASGFPEGSNNRACSKGLDALEVIQVKLTIRVRGSQKQRARRTTFVSPALGVIGVSVE